jgi:chromosome segregation ATPase
VAEVAQVGENFSARLDEIRSDVAHNADVIEEYRRSIVHIDPALAELRVVDDAMRQDITRFNTQAIERHEVIVDRLEDIRQATDGQFAEIRQAAEQRYERLGERIDEINELHRELGFRISNVAHQLDELRMIDANLRREMWQLHESRVRMRLEQAQAELDHVTNQRRVGDGENFSTAEPKRVTVRPGDR